MNTMARFVIENVTDAFGKEIEIGKIYGFSKSNDGIFTNIRILVTGFCPSTNYHVLPYVEGYACNDGTFWENKTDDRKESDVYDIVIENSNMLWPLPSDFILDDPCCNKLIEHIPTDVV